ncbi:MAG: PEP/pyruvate-binding domain-containing protein, partial [Saccharofermentanales bacterium]
NLDAVIDSLRLGDNVVWQVDDIEDYIAFTEPFVRQALEDRRHIVYMRFGKHRAVVPANERITVYQLIPDSGFESFATQVYNIITREGRYAFYIFDCLTELLEHWCSDLMLGNFFKITCPYLFVLDTVAYFAIIRNRHSFGSIARIRETTQLLIDLKRVSSELYIHPLKVWERYSPTMFLPHKYADGEFESITSSVDAAVLFNPRLPQQLSSGNIDYWDKLFISAEELLALPVGSPERVEMFGRLVRILIGRDPKIMDLAHRFLTLEDIIRIKNRQIGTGYIGGKSVGMILARNILTQDNDYDFSSSFEPHDSFYLGSDIFYTYLVQNGWWQLRMEQITPEQYFTKAPELKEKLLTGKFPAAIRERFLEMLEYFGQSPIIVRSSSLLEDNFGNAFAGKYESVFCVNQGSPEDRYEQFENAVRTVYASTMDENALNYRLKRNLSGKDEQMALLVQRVSGDYHG